MNEKDYLLAGEWKARIKKIYIKYWVFILSLLSLTFVAPIILLLVNYHFLLFFPGWIILFLAFLIIISITAIIPLAVLGPFAFAPERYEALTIVYQKQYEAYKKLQEEIRVKSVKAYQLKKEIKLEKTLSKIRPK